MRTKTFLYTNFRCAFLLVEEIYSSAGSWQNAYPRHNYKWIRFQQLHKHTFHASGVVACAFASHDILPKYIRDSAEWTWKKVFFDINQHKLELAESQELACKYSFLCSYLGNLYHQQHIPYYRRHFETALNKSTKPMK